MSPLPSFLTEGPALAPLPIPIPLSLLQGPTAAILEIPLLGAARTEKARPPNAKRIRKLSGQWPKRGLPWLANGRQNIRISAENPVSWQLEEYVHWPSPGDWQGIVGEMQME